jgi:hypothetical protein
MKSFNPEKAHIEALGFTPLGLPAPGGPVISPATAALAPAPTTAAAQAATANKRTLPI